MSQQIFISYAAEDKAIADRICETIEARGIKCWYAPRDVEYGRDFEESIVDAIAASQLLILILSSHSNSSLHVKSEIRNACLEEVNVPVLPFRTEDVPLNKSLRYYIGSVHWLDAVTPPLESHLKQLVEHINARLPRPKEEAPKLDPKNERVNELHSSAETAMAAGDWSKATELLAELVETDPQHENAKSQLEYALRRRGLANLYKAGLEHFEANDWLVALEIFRRLQGIDPNYKDVDKLVFDARSHLAEQRSVKQEEKSTPKQASVEVNAEAELAAEIPPSVTTRRGILFTVGLGLLGAIVFLVLSYALMRVLLALNLPYLYAAEVLVRDSLVGLMSGITASEFFRLPRWSTAKSRRLVAFITHGATGALLASATAAGAMVFGVVLYLYRPPGAFDLTTPRSKVSAVLRFYENAESYFLAMTIGFLIGLLICALRIRRAKTQKTPATKRSNLTLLFPFAGACVLFLLNLGLKSTPHGWMLTIRDTLFGVFLGITLSEFLPSAMWAIRKGERLRALVAYGATGATIAMAYSGAILSTVSGFYPDYVEFYFRDPILLAVYGFVVGSVIYSVRIVFRKPLRTEPT